METKKCETETYVLTDLDRLDPVTVFVTNYRLGQGRMVVECYGRAWTVYWGGMGDRNLQQFVLTCSNEYILNKMLDKTTQTDFDKITELAQKRGFDLAVNSDVEIALQSDDMAECFGSEWYRDLPTRSTPDYDYLGRILNAIKAAFSDEQKRLLSLPQKDDIMQLRQPHYKFLPDTKFLCVYSNLEKIKARPHFGEDHMGPAGIWPADPKLFKVIGKHIQD